MRRWHLRTVALAAVLASMTAAIGAAATDGQDASLALDVAIDGISAVAPGPDLPEGLPITLVFTITNTGSVSLTGTGLVDGVLGHIDCPGGALAPGESIACERSLEVERGKHRSTAEVTATAPDGQAVTGSTRVGFRGLAIEWLPELSAEVLIDGASTGAPGPEVVPGEEFTLIYRVFNTGTVPLQRLKVFDGMGVDVTCPTRNLDPGQSVECTAVAAAVEGPFEARVVVRAWDALGTRVQAVHHLHYVGKEPLIPAEFALTPLAAGRTAPPPGPRVPADGNIRWGVKVANTGADHLWGVYAYDLELGTLQCTARHLVPGETTRCTAPGPTVAGPMTGTIEVSAWASDGRHLTERIERLAFGYRPGSDILIETYVDGFDADRHAGPRRVAGDTLAFTYEIHNTGTVDLSRVRVIDFESGPVDCPARRLGVGETMTCSRTAVAELGWWSTKGKARARYGNQVVRDVDPTFWHVRSSARVSSIDLRVTVDGQAVGEGSGPELEVGERAEVLYRAWNRGNTVLWSMEFRHPGVDPDDMICWGDPDPLPGQAYSCRATIVAREGMHRQQVEAVAWNSDGTRIVGADWFGYVGVVTPT